MSGELLLGILMFLAFVGVLGFAWRQMQKRQISEDQSLIAKGESVHAKNLSINRALPRSELDAKLVARLDRKDKA